VHTTSDSTTGIKVSWTNTADAMYLGLESPGTGWVAIGCDPDTAMSGANFTFGYATSVRAFAWDEYGVGLFSHVPDTGNGGTEDIIDFAATESDETVFEFGIPLDSGDNTDKKLTSGSSYTCLIAYGNSDNFDKTRQKGVDIDYH
jgi:hypothetical protein